MKYNIFKHKLIRIGSQNDGGYFICPNSIVNTNNLISLGIETNWEFEKNFIKINPKTKIYCYDGQTNYKLIMKFFYIQVLKNLLFEFNFSLLKRSFIIYLNIILYLK